MSAHTQGPWRIGNIMQYVGYDCTTVGLMIGPVYLSGFEYGQKRCGEITDHVRERMLTDARLISAAPDMYEALKEMVRVADANGIDAHYARAVNSARAALAKAGQ